MSDWTNRGSGLGTRGLETSRAALTVQSVLPHPHVPASPNPVIDQLRTIGLHKSYRKGPVEVPVLRGVSMVVRPGEFLAIVGQSGCGKSTLLHLLGTLDAPDRGEIHYDGRRIDNLPRPTATTCGTVISA